jgi:hypothetical protein
MKKPVLLLLVSLAPCPLASPVRAATETTVGVTGRIEQLVLPGPELEAVPYEDRKTPVVLRMVRAYPHGTAFRYDLEYHGLEPGSFDLKNYLRRKDGSSTADLPPIPVRVAALLPPGQVQPNALEVRKSPRLGGYRTLLILGGVGWALGLLAIVYFGFLRRKQGPAAGEAAVPLSLADRLRPLVEGAIAGQLSQPQLASLERTLLAYWRKRLHLEQTDPARAIETLRGHAEAGPLLEQLEAWLHRPGAAPAVDPVRLLQPYQKLPADALEGSAA